MPPALQPSLMILMAPFAVGFSAYLSVAGRVDLFASSLFDLAVFMFGCWRRNSSACALFAFPYFVVGRELPAGGMARPR